MGKPKLPSPLVVMFWLNDENQMCPIACATDDKREDASRRADQCFNYSVHDYVPVFELEAAQARVRELTEAARLVIENIPGCKCQTVEFDMYAHDLESLLAKDHGDA